MKKNAGAQLVSMVLLLITWNGLSQIVAPENVTFIGAEKVAAEAQRTVFAVQVARTNQNRQLMWTPLGSGFLLARSNMTFGVTCDHVIAGAEKILTEPNALKAIFIGLDTRTNGYIRFPCVPVHRNKDSDVAILIFKVPFSREGKQLIDIKSAKIGEDLIGNDTDMVLGRGVLILGYPLGRR